MKRVAKVPSSNSTATATAAAGRRNEASSDHEDFSRNFPAGAAGPTTARPAGRLPAPALAAGPNRSGGGGGGHVSIELVDELDKLLFPAMEGLDTGGGAGTGKGSGYLSVGGGGGGSGAGGDVFVDDSPVRV